MARRRLGTTKFAEMKGVSSSRIRQLRIAGRIPEAEWTGSQWVFPENARILHPPERKRAFDKIKEWLQSEDWDRVGKREVVEDFIKEGRYWIENS